VFAKGALEADAAISSLRVSTRNAAAVELRL